MKRIEMTGKRFNLLTVEGPAKSKNGKSYWNCLCLCGNKTVVSGSNLRNGAVKSCGCLQHEPRNRTHGESKTKLYRHWISMIYRCQNPKNQAYKWYGARGIKVCQKWQTFEGFKKWVEETRTNEEYTVERIDVNGDYCPENCTWIPLSSQANNRRSNVMIEYNGKRQNLTDWCKELNLNYKRVHNRIYKLGWDFSKAISMPVKDSCY